MAHDKAALEAQFTSLLSIYNARAPTPLPTHAFFHSSPSSLPSHHHHGAPTSSPPSTSRSSITSYLLILFILIPVIRILGWCLQQTSADETSPLHCSSLEEAAAAKARKEAEETAKKTEEAARAARARMTWLDEWEGVKLRGDGSWRCRMEAEWRERELRRRGLWVEEVKQDGVVKRPDERLVEDEEQVEDEELVEIKTALVKALEVMAVCGHWVEDLFKKGVKTGAFGGGFWFAYRLLRYFTKHDYQRESNRVDRLLSAGIHFSASIFLVIILPIGTAFAVGWLGVGHNDRVEVCNLCGRTPICQLQINHTNGVDLCLKCRLQEEDRMEGEKRLEVAKQRWAYEKGTTVEAWEKKIKKKKKKKEEAAAVAAEEERYAQTASRLPSGQRSSPAPWTQRPRGQEVIDLLCSFEDAKAQYSGFPHRIPGQRQKLYNTFEAKQAFMRSIGEGGGYTGQVTPSMRKEMRSHQTRKDAWFADVDARLPVETRRVLWPQSSKWEKTPSKRFL
ncbi:MAG: hypothetical protein LQ348_001592 [Seirophora lacunosa]|nr:MAG: hypothetical protein LQ348_001592 [Seirophora lacunosa]